MKGERKPGGRLRLLAVLLVVAAAVLFIALVQRHPAPVAQEQPTRRPGAVAGESGEAATPLPAPLNAEETALFNAINQKRAEAGCPALALNDNLAQAARDQGLDMAEHNFFSHTGSDGSKPD